MIFRTAIRNIKNNSALFFFKAFGLSIALLVVIVISGWVFHELSYDKFFPNSERIYRLSVEQVDNEINFFWHFARTHQTWRRDLPDFFPQIEEMVELVPMFTSNVKIEENRLSTKKGFATDSSFFKVFNLEFKQGDPVHAIDNLNTVVVSQSFVDKHFNSSSPIGKLIHIKGADFDSFKEFVITGVFKDLPANCHFDFDFLIHFDPTTYKHRANNWAYTYYLLKEGASIKSVQLKMNDFMNLHTSEYDQKTCSVHFMPLEDIHLKSNIEREITKNGSLKQVYLFISIGLGILFMVALIYLNLCTVDYGKKIQNFNINRILGAKTEEVLVRLSVDSVFVVLLAVLVAILLLPPFIKGLSILGVYFDFSIKQWFFPHISIVLIAISLFFILLSLLPVLINHSVPIKLLVGKDNSLQHLGRTHKSVNSAMLFVQFFISILIITSAVILAKQNNFLLSNQLGGRENHIISIPRAFTGSDKVSIVFCDEISKLAEVSEVTTAMDNPTYLIKDMRQVETSFNNDEIKRQLLTICPIDREFFKFFGIKLIAGQTFRPYDPDREQIGYVLNESAIQRLEFDSPQAAINKSFKLSSINNDLNKEGFIVGVVEDFYFSSMYYKIQPTAYFQMPVYQGAYLVKTKPGGEKDAINQIGLLWQEHFPDYPFKYNYLDDIYSQTYQDELVQGKMLYSFAGLSVLLSILGLIAITNMVYLRKTKEIGIRKVNGARSLEILGQFNKDFVSMVLIAFVMAIPVAYIIIEKWLEGFAYRIVLGIDGFIIAGLISLSTAVLTISWRGWKVARKNPVEALRYE